ncbi:MAG: PAS domain-containing protein, partial [Nitrospirae bacterium]
ILLDPEHRIRYANRATLEFLKKEEREVLGRTCHEVFHHSPVPCYEREGREKEECGLLIALEGKEYSSVHYHRINEKNRYFHIRYIPFKEKKGNVPFIIEMVREITETYKLNEEKRILDQFKDLLQDTYTLEELFERLSLLAKRALKAQGCAIFLYDPKKRTLRLANHRYVNPSIVSHIEEIGLDECVTSYAIESGKPFVAETLKEMPESRLKPLLKQAGIGQIISIPIKLGNTVTGVYNITYKEERYYDKEDTRFFSLLMEIINRVYQRINHTNEIKKHGRRLNRLFDVVKALNQSTELNEKFERICDAVKEILNSEIAGIFLYDHDKSHLTLQALSGIGLD